MIKIFSRFSILLLIFTLTACDVIRVLAPVVLPAPTALPTNTPYPTPTPQPGATVQVKVRVPANTPSGSSLIMYLPDRVGGLANKTFILNNSGNNLWTTTLTVPIGSLLRYRFQRISGGQVSTEILANGLFAGDRLTLVTGSMNLEESIHGWNDTPFIGDKGRITGYVRDASSNQPLVGLIVMAGGQQTTTAFDGEYNFFNTLAGTPTPVTVFAPDGSFRTQTKVVSVNKEATANLDFALNAARTVKVSFVVALPVDTVKGAPVKLMGNILQMGDTFNSNPAGSTIASPRQITLAPLPDGRWAATLNLYEGLDLRYKYTLGGAVINGELNSGGDPVVRQNILGPDDIIIQDQVVAWKRSVDAPITFNLTVPASTPPADEVTMQFKVNGIWFETVTMWRASPTSWNYTLLNPVDFTGQAEYRFCRNHQCDTAPDGQTTPYRFTPTVLPQVLNNTVARWQWWNDQPAITTSLPPITKNVSFQAGIEIAPYNISDVPLLNTAFEQIKGTGADWVRLPIVWDAASANPPLIVPDQRTPLRTDLLNTIRAARERGLKVALYPQIKPASAGAFKGDLNAFFEAGKRDPKWWGDFFREYERFITYYADVAAFSGVEMLYVADSSLVRAFPIGDKQPPDADARWRNFIANTRKDHFNAALAYAVDFSGKAPTLGAVPPFVEALNLIDVRFSAALTSQANASGEELRKNAETIIDANLKPLATQYKKPIILTALYTATDGAATYCIGAATGTCQPFTNVAPTQPDVGLYTYDFNEQANTYEALLYTINTRAWLAGFYGGGYNAPVALRDKYFSPRAKPAEVIMASWFSRLK